MFYLLIYCTGALTVTMVTHVLAHVTRVVHACVPAARAVDISTVTRVDWTHALTALFATAAPDTQVIYSRIIDINKTFARGTFGERKPLPMARVK